MKNRALSAISFGLIGMLLTGCGIPITKASNTSNSTINNHSAKSGHVKKDISDMKSYVSNKYKVSLKYNKNWKRNPNYDIKFEGNSGFFQIDSISGKGLNIDAVTNSEAHHKLKPYGSHPKVTKMTVQGQEARLIIPSADQPKEYKHQAELIVKYPKVVTISGNKFFYFVLYANKSNIKNIAKTIKFLSTT